MLSRVADLIYWMSRYVERAENVARVIDVNLQLVLDAPAGGEEQWHSLVTATGDEADFGRRYRRATQENVLAFLTFDPLNPNSILSCLQSARENARGIREVISSDMWFQANCFYLMVKSAAAAPKDLNSAIEFFHEVKLASQLFAGVADATMTHGAGWHFLQIGRLLERADQASRILDVYAGAPAESRPEAGAPADLLPWGAVLRSASAFEMYCKQCGRVSPPDVVRFLMLDREFPRSILFCLRSAQSSLRLISGTPANTFRNTPEKLLGRLCSEHEFMTADGILDGGLHQYIDEFQTKLSRAAQAISERFFDFQPVLAPARPQGAAPVNA
jgi:uncharacterized alpha-E superfamily protein